MELHVICPPVVWLLSLSIVFLRLVHTAVRVQHSFCLTFDVVCQKQKLSLFLMFFYCFAFQFGKFLLACLQAHWLFAWLFSLLMNLSKSFKISVPVFFISDVLFWFFLRLSISLLTFPIWTCMLSSLSPGTLKLIKFFFFFLISSLVILKF